jgi:Tfp pilus assembly protein PilF
MNNARRLMDEKKWTDAEQHIRHVLKLDESNVEAWCALARVFNAKGQFAQASLAAIAALRIDEKCASAWLELGYAQKESKDWDRARLALNKAIECDPKNETARKYLAQVLKAMGDTGADAAAITKMGAIDRSGQR